VATERRPGSDRGRAAIDWQEAFLYYASLSAEERDYQTVADKFKVSRRTVERHGRRERWKHQAQELDRESVRAAVRRIRDQRAEKLIDTEKLVDATFVSYANQLVAGKVKVTPNHLATLHKLREQIWDRGDAEPALEASQPAQPVDAIGPIERKRQVLQALEDAGVLERLLHPDTRDEETA
jgi:hypothetical protein